MKQKNSFLLIIVFILLFLTSCDDNKNENVDVQKSEDIIKMSLISYDGKTESKYLIKSLGHTFLSFENISHTNINLLYDMVLIPGEVITISWWSIDKHFGVWYNVEAQFSEIYNRYDTRVSVYEYISQKDLDIVLNYFIQNDFYSILDNCSKHCLNAYNLVAENRIEIPFISTPTYIVKYIKKQRDYEFKINLGTGKMGYFNNGNFKEYFLENDNL